MKRILFFSIIIAILFMTACSDNKENGIETMAEDFFAHFVNEEYEETVQYFDETLARELPQEELKKLNEVLREQLGEFIDSEYSHTDEVDGYERVIIHAIYEVSDVSVIVVFNDQNKVSGFFYQ